MTYAWAIAPEGERETPDQLQHFREWADLWDEVERALLARLADGLIAGREYADAVLWLTGCGRRRDPMIDGYAEVDRWCYIGVPLATGEKLRIEQPN